MSIVCDSYWWINIKYWRWTRFLDDRDDRFPITYHENNIVLVSIRKEGFAEASYNLARYKSENNFVLTIKIIRTLKLLCWTAMLKFFVALLSTFECFTQIISDGSTKLFLNRYLAQFLYIRCSKKSSRIF